MKIYPAIDMINHQAVRLTKGDFATAKTYATDPVAVAKEFAKAGASFIHLIDLDGARQGFPANTETIVRILEETNLKLQVGGGLRTLDAAKTLLDRGVDRIILGSLAVKDPAAAEEFFKELGADRITLALDCQRCDTEQPIAAVNGWQAETTVSLWELIEHYLKLGVSRVLCTDIARDGTNQGSNRSLYERMLKRYPELNIQASGGIASLDELSELAGLGLESCVLGKSLYEGNFTLEAALLRGGQPC